MGDVDSNTSIIAESLLSLTVNYLISDDRYLIKRILLFLNK